VPQPAPNPSPNRSTAQAFDVRQAALAQSKRRVGKPSATKSSSQHQHSLGKPLSAGLANQRIAKPAAQRKQRASAHELRKQAADKSAARQSRVSPISIIIQQQKANSNFIHRATLPATHYTQSSVYPGPPGLPAACSCKHHQCTWPLILCQLLRVDGWTAVRLAHSILW